MVTLRKMGEEPVEGIVLATYVPKILFSDFDPFSDPKESLLTLDKLVSKLVHKLPTRYKWGVRRTQQEVKSLLVYGNEMTNSNGNIKSNSISLTGQLLNEVVVEPGMEEIFTVSLHVGFTYPCDNHVVLVLDTLEKDFMFLSDKIFQPDIKIIKTSDNTCDIGNLALYLIYGKSREITVATIDGKSMKKRSYIVAMH